VSLTILPLLLSSCGPPALDVVLEVCPTPSPRPRFASKPFPKAYMPREYLRKKGDIRALLLTSGACGVLSGPLRVHVVARVPVPRSYPRWKVDACWRGELWPSKGRYVGDVDNYLKTILDACSGDSVTPGVWRDDGSIPCASIELFYARPDVQGGRPHWRLTVWQIPGRLAAEATKDGVA